MVPFVIGFKEKTTKDPQPFQTLLLAKNVRHGQSGFVVATNQFRLKYRQMTITM